MIKLDIENDQVNSLELNLFLPESKYLITSRTRIKY